MKLQCIKSSHLPPLAWCARIDRGDETVRVHVGGMVETRPEGFVEGAWNGLFDRFDFASSTIVVGTGGHLDGRGIQFVGSIDRLSPLFSISRGDSMWVSNSPVFALQASDDGPDPAYPFYMYDMLRIFRRGLFQLNGSIPTATGARLGVHFGAILSVGRDLSVEFETHRPGPVPDDFDSYRHLLVEGVRAVVENAADTRREHPYLPLAALSRGYDSCATAALAKHARCTEAITFSDSRMDDPQIDSGAPIAPFLDMTCSEYDRWAYLKLDSVPEREFGLIPHASLVTQASWEDELPGRVLITGRYGHTVWSMSYAHLADELSLPWAGILSGVSHLESRLRIGYQEFAPANIGARHNRVIQGISNSEEMRPWSFGGSYNRTIPRRIAEEAGLPREQFGYMKVATGSTHLINSRAFTKAGLKEYRQFRRDSLSRQPRHRLLYWRLRASALHAIWTMKSLILRNHHRFVRTSAFQRRFPFIANKSPKQPDWEFMHLFQWTFESIKHRYEAPKDAAEEAVLREMKPDPVETIKMSRCATGGSVAE